MLCSLIAYVGFFSQLLFRLHIYKGAAGRQWHILGVKLFYRSLSSSFKITPAFNSKAHLRPDSNWKIFIPYRNVIACHHSCCIWIEHDQHRETGEPNFTGTRNAGFVRHQLQMSFYLSKVKEGVSYFEMYWVLHSRQPKDFGMTGLMHPKTRRRSWGARYLLYSPQEMRVKYCPWRSCFSISSLLPGKMNINNLNKLT